MSQKWRHLPPVGAGEPPSSIWGGKFWVIQRTFRPSVRRVLKNTKRYGWRAVAMTNRLQIAPVLVLAGLLVTSGSARAVPGDRQEKEEKATVEASGKIALVIKNARAAG